MRRSDSDRHTAGIQAAVEGGNQVNPCTYSSCFIYKYQTISHNITIQYLNIIQNAPKIPIKKARKE